MFMMCFGSSYFTCMLIFKFKTVWTLWDKLSKCLMSYFRKFLLFPRVEYYFENIPHFPMMQPLWEPSITSVLMLIWKSHTLTTQEDNFITSSCSLIYTANVIPKLVSPDLAFLFLNGLQLFQKLKPLLFFPVGTDSSPLKLLKRCHPTHLPS